jgi:hypothetical protein
MKQVEDAAKASGIPAREAVQNIQSGFQQAQGGMQSESDAMSASSQQS